MQNIFVYGTLKKNFKAHQLLDNYNSIYIKTVRTEPKYQLYKINWFPGMVVDELQKGKGVLGEVYSVSDDCIEALDHYEGAPNLFRREKIDLSDGTTALAYIFNETFVGKDKIESGEWLNGKEEIKEDS